MIRDMLLEKRVEEGKAERNEVLNLKGGEGKVIIYKFTTEHQDPKVYEHGVIVLTPGSSIGMHEHTDDSEKYELFEGKAECDGFLLTPGKVSIVYPGGRHSCKNLANKKSYIGFEKRK